jgi:REP element-mobilizing transposase RayT
MANTYTQIHLHVVFAVDGRQTVILEKRRDTLEKYIAGIIRNQKQKLLSIFCMPDHTHMLIGLRPDLSLSALMREVKSSSSRFINEQNWIAGKFHWQEGYGAFSYSLSQIPVVAKYIENQRSHHHRQSFREEYIDMLKKFNVDYDERYIFQ